MALSACKTIQVDISINGVVDITLQRESHLNALNEEMIRELFETITLLKEDNSVRILCLQGAGKNFCAGADIEWMQKNIDYDAKENFTEAMKLSQLLSALYEFPKPTLVTTHGAVYGGAIGLVACCDIALSHQDTQFCLSETKLGLVPAMISPYVIAAIGARAFNYLMLTARTFSALEAQQKGLVQEVIPNPVQLSANKNTLIEQLLNNAPKALIEGKKMTRHLAIDSSIHVELAEIIASLRVGEEAQNRMKAFLNKKK